MINNNSNDYVINSLKRYNLLLKRADLPKKYRVLQNLYETLNIDSLIQDERANQPSQVVALMETVDKQYAAMPFTCLDNILHYIQSTYRNAIEDSCYNLICNSNKSLSTFSEKELLYELDCLLDTLAHTQILVVGI